MYSNIAIIGSTLSIDIIFKFNFSWDIRSHFNFIRSFVNMFCLILQSCSISLKFRSYDWYHLGQYLKKVIFWLVWEFCVVTAWILRRNFGQIFLLKNWLVCGKNNCPLFFFSLPELLLYLAFLPLVFLPLTPQHPNKRLLGCTEFPDRSKPILGYPSPSSYQQWRSRQRQLASEWYVVIILRFY